MSSRGTPLILYHPFPLRSKPTVGSRYPFPPPSPKGHILYYFHLNWWKLCSIQHKIENKILGVIVHPIISSPSFLSGYGRQAFWYGSVDHPTMAQKRLPSRCHDLGGSRSFLCDGDATQWFHSLSSVIRRLIHQPMLLLIVMLILSKSSWARLGRYSDFIGTARLDSHVSLSAKNSLAPGNMPTKLIDESSDGWPWNLM